MAKPFVRTSALQQTQPIVDNDGRPLAWFVRLLNDNNGNVTEAINALAAIPDIQAALLDLDQATQDARDAADAANSAIQANAREQALINSYIDPPSVLTASPTTITIAAHARQYADGTSASVNGGTIAATGAEDTDYVYYDDPGRVGGAVAYQVSTTQPIQTGDRHVVGAVNIPTTGTSDGGEGPRPPGWVLPRLEGNEP